MDVAANFTQLYESAETEVILTVLTHKVLSSISPHVFQCSRTFLSYHDPPLSSSSNPLSLIDFCSMSSLENHRLFEHRWMMV